MTADSRRLNIIVVGASGDLARRKIFPALFSLYCQGFLPEEVNVFGYARTQMDDEAFRAKITENLTCRYVPGESCAEKMAEFLERCYYLSGQYDSSESFSELGELMRKVGGDGDANRMFYLAIPPALFGQVARAIHASGMAEEPEGLWSRVVIEKPFGRDRESSDELAQQMAEVFREDQTYRIDHYLGKEVIQNLMVLRFANLIFEPIWSNLYISRVQISWTEQIGVEGRGGYFDHYGIIRDVMQNHLLQMLALVTMEPPIDVTNYVRDEKVKALRSVDPVRVDELTLGQYEGYRDDEKVPSDSLTPTYAAAVLHIRNRRWEGVPFLLRAGKALDTQGAEIHIEFRGVPGNIFCEAHSASLPSNELVIRVQPDEAIYFKIMNKKPGLTMELTPSDLNLLYESAFEEVVIPDAYESLLLDVIRGDRGLFIREDELQASWDIFTPALHQIDEQKVEPEIYKPGSAGPSNADKLASRYRAEWR